MGFLSALQILMDACGARVFDMEPNASLSSKGFFHKLVPKDQLLLTRMIFIGV